ncbi:kinesin-like protein KIN-14C isoform X2 [Wolffia australiana]
MANQSATGEAKRLSDVSTWLNALFPNLNLPLEPHEEELRTCLLSGDILCGILSKLNLKSEPEGQNEKERVHSKRSEIIKNFLCVIDGMKLRSFKERDLNQGSMSVVVDCLLSLKAYMESAEDSMNSPNSLSKHGFLSRKRWKFLEADKIQGEDKSNGNSSQSVENYPVTGEGKRRNISDLKFHGVLRNSGTLDSPSALSHHTGYKFHEVFQLKQGRYSDLSPAKISELLKSNGVDKAPTQTLLSFVNGILDESIERKNDEIQHRSACLLRWVLQEIERRISTQAEHIRNQNNQIKAREEKYQSRIRVLETLANGTSEESRMVTNHLHLIKAEKIKLEERKKQEDQDRYRLSKEKETCDLMVAELKQEMEKNVKSHEQHRMSMEMRARETQAQLEARIKEIEFLLEQSKQKVAMLEAEAALRAQTWNAKEQCFKKFMSYQLQAVQSLRVSSDSLRNKVMMVQSTSQADFASMGVTLKGLAEASENYHAVLEENRKLFNEVQELKGNIRVYCRIRPFLPGQKLSHSTVDYVGENGELLVINPSKMGKDGHRMFKLNKVFSPSASQEDVFLDTRPLIRSVLDGYNVCIFAYGQTGSGKTYTMSGPDILSKEEWGVNYRALDDLFQISHKRRNIFNYEISVQMVEIYNEQVRDLLTNNGHQKKLGILSASQPNGLAVPEASMHQVKVTTDVLELMRLGHANRAVGATALNERSSRSHSILSVHVRGLDLENGASLRGTLHLVDLAGSERVDRSEATGDRLREAQHINKSLSALGDVIFALAQKSPHVPYRNSKLTQVLQTSLGGQAKTLMFVQVNPEADSYSETVSTLKFAERVSGVELGAARSSKEGKDVRELMQQVASLKNMIAIKDEEIEQLQLLKDVRTQTPLPKAEKPGTNALRHSASSPGPLTLGGGGAPRSHRKLLLSRNPGALSDGYNTSADSDKLSETASLQSMNDSGHFEDDSSSSHWKQAGESNHLHHQGLGSCADSEERMSDMSEGTLSVGVETDSNTETNIMASQSSKSLDLADKIGRSRSARLSQHAAQQSSRVGPASTLSQSRTSSVRKVPVSSRPSSSSSRPTKGWK